MSEKYLIVGEPEQVPPYDPQAMAEGLGLTLVGFLGPLLLELDQWLDKRLIRTFVQAIEAMLTFRDRINGLVLSELGSYLDPIGQGAAPSGSAGYCIGPSGRPRSSSVFCGGGRESRVEQWASQSVCRD